MDIIKGLTLTPLKIIPNPKGDILHILKKSDPSFVDFGEAYFSIINPNEKKGWKKHLSMTLNVVVPVGEIQFMFYDDRQESETFEVSYCVNLGEKNYQRLTIEPGIWMGFKGIGVGLNLLINIANIEHNVDEADSRALESLKLNW